MLLEVNKMSIGDKIRNRRIELGLSQEELANIMGYKSRSTINKIELGINDITQTKIAKFAKALQTTVSDLMDWEDNAKESQNNLNILDNNKIRLIPLYETVSAGFGAYADSQIIDYTPIYIKSDAEAEETLCIRVEGDSMYPKIEDGDIIQVHKQDSVDSGSIAVVLIDGEEGLVKKVVYGDDWIELHSLNPEYKTKRFEGPEVLRVRVVGLVKSVIKTL